MSIYMIYRNYSNASLPYIFIHTDETVLIDSIQGMPNLHVDTDNGRS